MDGSYRWLSWRPAAEKGYVYAAARDITDLKSAEDQLRVSRQELAGVSRHTTMGVMAASIAHEVNQPLAAVRHSPDELESGDRKRPSAGSALRGVELDISASVRRRRRHALVGSPCSTELAVTGAAVRHSARLSQESGLAERGGTATRRRPAYLSAYPPRRQWGSLPSAPNSSATAWQFPGPPCCREHTR